MDLMGSLPRKLGPQPQPQEEQEEQPELKLPIRGVPAPSCPHPGSDGSVWQLSPASGIMRVYYPGDEMGWVWSPASRMLRRPAVQPEFSPPALGHPAGPPPSPTWPRSPAKESRPMEE
jgi:hypothetical protein